MAKEFLKKCNLCHEERMPILDHDGTVKGIICLKCDAASRPQ